MYFMKVNPVRVCSSCVSTCDNTADSSQCGVIGFACRDPSANDFGFCPASNSIRYGDGFCDMFNSDLTLHLVRFNAALVLVAC